MAPIEPSRDAERDVAARTSADDLVVRADAPGVILYVSESCRSLGYEPGDLIGRSGADFVHPDDLARFAANSAELARVTRLRCPAAPIDFASAVRRWAAAVLTLSEGRGRNHLKCIGFL